MFDNLESRTFLAFNPSGREQAALEFINRMRQNPAAEVNLLLASTDSHIKSALSAFDVNVNTLKKQWAKLKAVPPVAWNESLYRAAIEHTKEMIEHDAQQHQLPGEASLRDRTVAQGYTASSFLGENIFAYVENVLHAHAGFAIDWGNGPGGIQSPPGHRNSIMGADYKEAGVAVLDAPAGPRETGPLLTTQDFGGDVSGGNAFLMGTVRRERKNSSVYDAGEGLGNVSITISGPPGTFKTATLGAGAFQIKVPAGTYTITARGAALGGTITRKNVAMGSANLKSDFVLPPDLTNPTAKLSAGNVTAGGAKGYTFKVTYTDNVAVSSKTVGNGDVEVVGPDGFRAVATLVSKTPTKNAATITAIYRMTPPGKSWNGADNGSYSVRLRSGQVRDLSNRPAAAGTLGGFKVTVGASARRFDSAFSGNTPARLPNIQVQSIVDDILLGHASVF